MADQTADREPNRQEGKIQHLAAGVAEYFRGEAVAFQATGLLGKGGDDASTEFAGIVVKHNNIVNSADRLEIYREGVFSFVYTPGDADQADVGTLVYLEDSQSVDIAATTTNDVLVGRIVEVVSATEVRVDITNRV